MSCHGNRNLFTCSESQFYYWKGKSAPLLSVLIFLDLIWSLKSWSGQKIMHFFLWLALCNSYCLSTSGMLHLYRVYLAFWWSASHSGFCCLEQWTILCVSFGQPWATVYLFRLSSFCGFAGALVVYVFSHGPCVCGLGIHPSETCLHVWGFIDFRCHQPHR